MCPRVFHYQHRLPGNQNKITDVCPSLPQTRSFPWPQLGVLPAEYGMRVHLVEHEYFIPTVKVNCEKNFASVCLHYCQNLRFQVINKFMFLCE